MSDLVKTTWRGALALVALVACGWLAAPGSAAAAPGDLDTTFGPPNGFVALDISPNLNSTQIQDLLVEPGTGKIVAAMPTSGIPQGSLCSFAIARFLPNGSLDPTFNPGGAVPGISDTAFTFAGCPNGAEVPFSVARTSDGKYVVAGMSGDRILLARFTDDGDLDASFNGDPDPTLTDGQAMTTVPGVSDISRVAGVHVAPDGKITVAATAEGPGPSFENTIVVARYLQTGALDTTFDESPAVAPGGLVFVNDALTAETGNGMLVDPTGRTVIAGSVAPAAGGQSQVFVARLTATGTRDTAFSGDGINAFGLGAPLGADLASDVVRQPDGRLVLAAQVDPILTPASFAVAAVTDSGQLDGGFGAGGATVTPVGAVGELGLGSKIASQPDGKLVVAGNVAVVPLTNPRVRLVRYQANGALDTAYGTQGVAQPATFATPDPLISALDVGADGKAVIGGLVQTTPLRSLLARFQTDAPPGGGPPVVPDTTAPETTISKKPKKKSSKKKVKVEFSSSEAGSTFTCQLNKKAAVKCTSPFKAKSKKGKNKLLVTATDAAGNRDATPAVAKWKYVRKR